MGKDKETEVRRQRSDVRGQRSEPLNREPLNREPLFLHSALVFLFDFKIILKSEATSLFDVGRSMLDVHLLICSMFDVRLSKQLRMA